MMPFRCAVAFRASVQDAAHFTHTGCNQEAGRAILQRLDKRTLVWWQLIAVLIILLALPVRHDNWSDCYTRSKVVFNLVVAQRTHPDLNPNRLQGAVDEIFSNVTHDLGMYIHAATQHAGLLVHSIGSEL